jgi:hypothetical protein
MKTIDDACARGNGSRGARGGWVGGGRMVWQRGYGTGSGSGAGRGGMQHGGREGVLRCLENHVHVVRHRVVKRQESEALP